MQEIVEVPWNGLAAVSTFSGCGGSCLGYRWAGFRVLWASEFVPAAQATYKANHPDSLLDTRDIRDVRSGQILAATGLKEGELDLLDGSPPCCAFSLAGKGASKWGKVSLYSDAEQRTDDLFFEFARLVRGLRPRMFVAENVPALAVGAAKGYFKEILKTLKDCGYRVKARILDAQWLGVPQWRERLIFMGVREDLEQDPTHPAPWPSRYVIKDACPQILRVRINNAKTGPKIYEADRHACITIMAAGMGGSWISQHEVYARTEGGKAQWRRVTIAELRRLCGFPDDFQLTGSYGKQWERLGRAVPPPVSRAIGLEVVKTLKAE